MTETVTKHEDGYSVSGGYEEIRFTEEAANEVAALMNAGTWRWDDIQPILEDKGIQILA